MNENDLSDDSLKAILSRLPYPIKMSTVNAAFNITDIILTTVCRYVNNEIQCTCDGEFTWNSTFCSKYQPCSANADGQTCDCIRSKPTEGTFCELAPITTTTQSTPSTNTTRSTTTESTTTTTVSTTTITTQVRQKYAFEVKDLSFTDELNNRSSALFKNRSKEFKMLLEEAYRSADSSAAVDILGFTKGSVIVLHEVRSNKPLTEEEITTSRNRLKESIPGIVFLTDDEIPCNHEVYGTTNYNSTAEIPCKNQGGVEKIRCEKNGKYGDKMDFCISTEINNILQAVNSTDLDDNFSNLLQDLSNATADDNIITPGNVEAVVTILSQISNVNASVNETDMENFLQTINTVIAVASLDTWRILTSETPENNPSSQLLESVENFTSRLTLQTGTLLIKKDNLELIGTRILNNSTFINVTFANFSIEQYSNLSANIFISPDEFEDNPNATVITIAYPTWIDILSNTTTFKGNFAVNGLVTTVTLSIKKPVNINMTFSPRDHTLDFSTAMCAFWDFSDTGAWNNTGCKTEINGENIICTCEHLTSFSILMSPFPVKNFILDIISIIGVAVSIGSLLIAIIIEAIVWKHVTKNKTSYTRHVGILNIAVSLLVADIWFIVASATESGTGACAAATFFIHFFYLALFFWMFTLGLLLVYRLLFLFHDLSKSIMMGLSFTIGYLCPLIISVITIGVTYPRKSYTREDACWLGWEKEYPLLAFVIPALAIIAINIIILIVVIFKLLRPSIGDRSRGHNPEKEMFKQIVRSIAVLTPILGLTWAFGIPTFQKDSHVAFHFIFTILNAFQGFFILVFGTFMDNKVREALMKTFSLSGFSSRSKTVQSTSTAKPSSKPGHRFHARKKGYNLTHQLYTSDNNQSLSYSTLN
ncbi:adhesion G-protein coupled receptor F1-like isoform X2 [Heterodontus francisci]